jgi:hypothetical protein
LTRIGPDYFGFAAIALAIGTMAGCAPAMQGAPGEPVPDAAALEAELRRTTIPSGPRQVTFAWELDEAGARFRGQGVARFVAPERFRLDLYGPRGETYLAAALVDDEMRVPATVAERFPLPSPALLWGAVGVVAPPADAVLRSASRAGEENVLRYDLDGDVLEYRVADGHLRTIRRLRRNAVAESVDLTRDTAGEITRALYRDWIAYRSLTLTLEASADVSGFPEDTWNPPGTGR